MSPLAIEIVDTETLSLRKGDSVDLEIVITGQRIVFEGLVIDLVQQNDQIKLIGIRLAQRIESHSNTDRRRGPRWICPDEFFPTCVTKSHLRDYTIFQIRDLSAHGMQLICSLRNKMLVEGMQLRLTCNFPMVGDFVTMATIVRVQIVSHNNKDRLALGVEFTSVTEHMRQTIGQYLVQFSTIESLEELRQQGLRPNSIANGVNFYYLKSEEDYRAVLSLRRIAYDEHLAINSVTDQDMGDMHDGVARILVGKHSGKVIATARIRFNTPDSPLEHESYIEWPSNLPRRDQVIEVSRVCTDPEFRRGDLLAGLFEFACSTSIQHERPFVVISSTKDMVPFYEKVGFRSTGLSHSEPTWNKEQFVMIAHSFDCMVGKKVNPFYWNAIWRNASAYSIANGTVVPEKIDRIRLVTYQMIGPFAQAILSAMRLWRRRRLRRT